MSNWIENQTAEFQDGYDYGYQQGRADAIDEFAKILHKSIGLDRSLNHHDVDFLADMAKENGND